MAVKSELEELKAAAKPPGAKERNTFLKLVLGMAVMGYGYASQAARSKTAKDIAGDLEELGIPLDEDTIRSKLKEAVDEFGHLSPSPDEPKR